MKISEFYYGLTKRQLRRVKMKAYGLNGVEIADIEERSHRAIYASLNAAEKKILKNIREDKRQAKEDSAYMKIRDVRVRLWLMRENGIMYQKIMHLQNFSESYIYKTWTSVKREIKEGVYVYDGIENTHIRRICMKADGLSVGVIAMLECVSDKAIYLSLKKVKKILEKNTQTIIM